MEKLTNERVVESGLPLLDEGHFETAIVCSLGVYWDGGPDIQVVMVLPVAQCQLCLNQSFVGKLEILA